MNIPGSLAEWTCGLDDSVTLAAAYAGMPGDDASTIPWRVRILENPHSPLALPGAIDLFGHDCVHILLGRGTLPPDEAFVLGVTMGASGRLSPWQQSLFAFATRRLYRGPFRFTRTDLVVYDMAVEFAANSRISPLHDVPWREWRHRSLGEIRSALGVDTGELVAVYEAERVLWPDSPAAHRLPRRQGSASREPPR